MKLHLMLIGLVTFFTFSCVTDSAPTSADGPHLRVDPSIYDFGTVVQGARIKTEIQLSNEGNQELKILDTKTECSCTLLKLKQKSLSPGESITVKAVFDTDHFEGEVHKNIVLTTNNSESPESIISLKGKILPKS